MVHLEGGEITGTIDDNIRHSISKLAQCHLVSTEKARDRLIQMGENPERVYFVGCPLYDKILNIKLDTDYLSDINGNTLNPREYIICIFHPVCNDFENCLRDFECLISGLLRMKKTVIFFYPNIDNGSKQLIRLIRINNLEQNKDFIFVKNMNVEKYINLLAHSSMIVGNSSSGIREACIFGIPSISIGSRQQNREHSDNVIFIPALRSGGQIYTLMEELYKTKKRFTKNYLYGDGKSIERIIKILKRVNTMEIIKKFHQ
jgi:UDP-hydrolysing UDP-N-acetyl-D-glucosamine 2-epimerase